VTFVLRKRKTLETGQYVFETKDGKLVITYLKGIRKAVGIMSRTKSGGHYLILDFDNVKRKIVDRAVDYLKKRANFVTFYRTTHGYHVISDLKVGYREFAIRALQLRADPVWVGIGLKRGYWFLEVKKKELLPELERRGFRLMVIERTEG
jgi:hypothetical protein